MYKQEVTNAIAEIKASFPDFNLESLPDGNGGAYVKVIGLPLSGVYAQMDTWVAFQITHAYPYADVYPHFVRPDLSRTDKASFGQGLSLASFRDQPAVQISRRSNHLNPVTDTAALKLQKVMKWLNVQ